MLCGPYVCVIISKHFLEKGKNNTKILFCAIFMLILSSDKCRKFLSTALILYYTLNIFVILSPGKKNNIHPGYKVLASKLRTNFMLLSNTPKLDTVGLYWRYLRFVSGGCKICAVYLGFVVAIVVFFRCGLWLFISEDTGRIVCFRLLIDGMTAKIKQYFVNRHKQNNNARIGHQTTRKKENQTIRDVFY